MAINIKIALVRTACQCEALSEWSGTWLSPFLYSREQSSRTMRGSLIMRLILGWVTSLLTITPFRTHESSMMPPGTWIEKEARSTDLAESGRIWIACRRSTSSKASYLLHLGVLLDVDLFASVVLQLHGADGIQGDAAGQLGPAAQSFGVDGGVDDLQHHGAVRRVNRGAEGRKRGRSIRWWTASSKNLWAVGLWQIPLEIKFKTDITIKTNLSPCQCPCLYLPIIKA